MNLVSVVLSGGAGTRLWPASRQAYPKPFMKVGGSPLLAQAMISYDNAQASLTFDGNTPTGHLDTTTLIGTTGTAVSQGPDHNDQRITITTRQGVASPNLGGTWFLDGFHGTMAELLCAIEEDRQPNHNAKGNLRSLAVCFAAVASAESAAPEKPGAIRKPPL